MENKKINPEYPYSFDKFDKGYYGEGARGGFKEEIFWDNPIQQNELKKKFNIIGNSGNYESILFIGCAFGNEVRYFRNMGKLAEGLEVSEYAVSNCDKSVKEYIKLYNGWQLKDYSDKSMDVIASFDVLTLIPDEILYKLIKEMCRVSKSRIIIRTVVDYENKYNEEYLGNDGVSFRLLTLEKWKELFLKENFYIKEFSMDYKNEVIFIFQRND